METWKVKLRKTKLQKLQGDTSRSHRYLTMFTPMSNELYIFFAPLTWFLSKLVSAKMFTILSGIIGTKYKPQLIILGLQYIVLLHEYFDAGMSHKYNESINAKCTRFRTLMEYYDRNYQSLFTTIFCIKKFIFTPKPISILCILAFM